MRNEILTPRARRFLVSERLLKSSQKAEDFLPNGFQKVPKTNSNQFSHLKGGSDMNSVETIDKLNEEYRKRVLPLKATVEKMRTDQAASLSECEKEIEALKTKIALGGYESLLAKASGKPGSAEAAAAIEQEKIENQKKLSAMEQEKTLKSKKAVADIAELEKAIEAEFSRIKTWAITEATENFQSIRETIKNFEWRE